MFGSPFGVAVDTAGNLYIADRLNNSIRKGYPAPRITRVSATPDFKAGQFSFQFSAPAAQLVVVESSNDLMTWVAVWTNSVPGSVEFRESQSSLVPHQFYRTHLP